MMIVRDKIPHRAAARGAATQIAVLEDGVVVESTS